jgi:AcrR family transcriptional regulator
MARTGRRPGDSGTRQAILQAAQEAFCEHGYDRASIRAIAHQAKVDPALVHHYFGTKQRLFVAAVQFPFQPAEVIDRLLGGDPGTVGERLVRFILRIGEDQANRDAVIGLLRSAATTEHAATLLREFASEAIIGWMAADLDPPNPRLRPTLVASQLIGLFMLRYIIKVEPLASASVEEVVAAVAPTVQRYLTAELNLQPSV